MRVDHLDWGHLQLHKDAIQQCTDPNIGASTDLHYAKTDWYRLAVCADPEIYDDFNGNIVELLDRCEFQ